jgi:hypothetical protein
MLPGDPGDDVNWGRYVVKVIGFNNCLFERVL